MGKPRSGVDCWQRLPLSSLFWLALLNGSLINKSDLFEFDWRKNVDRREFEKSPLEGEKSVRQFIRHAKQQRTDPRDERRKKIRNIYKFFDFICW